MSISAIIPTWNRANCISDSIKSVINQTLAVSEIIIVDDGSTDNTEEIVKNIQFPNLRYFKITHSGLPAVARNIGIAKSTGDWIAFLDSDDIWLPTKIEKQVKIIKSMKCDLIGSNSFSVKNKKIIGNVLKTHIFMPSFINLLHENTLINSSILVRKSIINKVGRINENANLKAVEDYHLWLKIAIFGYKIVIHPEPLLLYGDNPKESIRGSVSSNLYQQKCSVLSDLLTWSGKEKHISLINYLFLIIELIKTKILMKVY